MYILKTLQEENVHNNSLMGLKVWWSWGSRKKISKSQQVGRFFENRPPTWRLPGANLSQILRFWNFFRKPLKVPSSNLSPSPHHSHPPNPPHPPNPHTPPDLNRIRIAKYHSNLQISYRTKASHSQMNSKNENQLAVTILVLKLKWSSFINNQRDLLCS